MRAAVFYRPKEPLQVEEVIPPVIDSHEVLVKIASCGICRGDLQRVDGLIPVKTPIILGHEPAGTIVEVGNMLEAFTKGEKVLITGVGCGKCYYCVRGKDNLCAQIPMGLGLERDGCYAQYAKVYPRELIKLPPNIPVEAGSAISASTGTAFHAINKAKVSIGESVAVYGTGDLGTQAIQILKIIGATVFAVDIDDAKLQYAKQFGADQVINAIQEDPVRQVKELTDGRGVDVAFEVVGLPHTMQQAIDSVKKGGRIVDIGSVMTPIMLRMMPFRSDGLSLTKELTLMTTTHFTKRDAIKVIDLAEQGKIDFEVGTVKVPLNEINDGFKLKREGSFLRILVIP